jgi:hypothetical protein
LRPHVFGLISPGGIVKAEGLGDGCNAYANAIAKL